MDLIEEYNSNDFISIEAEIGNCIGKNVIVVLSEQMRKHSFEMQFSKQCSYVDYCRSAYVDVDEI